VLIILSHRRLTMLRFLTRLADHLIKLGKQYEAVSKQSRPLSPHSPVSERSGHLILSIDHPIDLRLHTVLINRNINYFRFRNPLDLRL
jgi:hypothetical protein